MACILPYKDSLSNSRQTLLDVEAIDESGVIINEPLFDEWVSQMSTQASQAYNLDNEKLWFKNPIVNEPIVPNKEQFNKIDEKRKLMGLYEDQISGSLPIHFMTEEENGYPILTALWKIKERNVVYPQLIDKINDLLKVEEFSTPIYLANDDVFDSPLHYANYDPINNIINIRKEGYFPETYSDHTVLHEIIHAMTYNKVLNNPSQRAKLELLLEITKQEVEKKYGKVNYSGKWYGLTNEFEFLAEGFSNPEFIKELMSIRYWSQSLFDSFLDWIFETLGIEKELTIYHQLYDLFVEITNLSVHPNKILPEDGKFPSMEPVFRQGEETQVIPPDEQIVYQLRVVNALQSDKVRQPKLNSLQGFYNDLQKQGIPSQQIDLVKDILSDTKENVTKEDIVKELLVRYSFSVEINTRMTKVKHNHNKNLKEFISNGYYYFGSTYGYVRYKLVNPLEVSLDAEVDESTKENISQSAFESAQEDSILKEKPTQHYSNLTVPGGTNYTENEIRIPGIVPAIKGHAQFSTNEGIGWFRSDDKLDMQLGNTNFKSIADKPTNTRRILELQSDWGQKRRNSNEKDIDIKYDIQQIINDLEQSGELKIDCN